MNYSDIRAVNDEVQRYRQSGARFGSIMMIPLESGLVELILIAPEDKGGGWVHFTLSPVDDFVGMYERVHAAAQEKLKAALGEEGYERYLAECRRYDRV